MFLCSQVSLFLECCHFLYLPRLFWGNCCFWKLNVISYECIRVEDFSEFVGYLRLDVVLGFCAHVSLVFLATSCCRCFESESVQFSPDCSCVFLEFRAIFWNFCPAFLAALWGRIFGEISARTCENTYWSSIDSFLSGAPLIFISPISPPFSRALRGSDFCKVVLIFLGGSFWIWFPMMMWCYASIFSLSGYVSMRIGADQFAVCVYSVAVLKSWFFRNSNNVASMWSRVSAHFIFFL